VLYGGDGDDIINGGSGDDRLNGDGGADIISAGSGADIVSGGSGNDDLSGNSGDDPVYGGVGNDYLSAGSGNDIVSGGSGNDRMFGGLGADSFIWASDDILNEKGVASLDRIADFSDQDVLDFSMLAQDTTMNLDQLVSFSETDRGTSVSVNLSGKDGDFTDVVVLQDGFGVSAQAYLESDTLFI